MKQITANQLEFQKQVKRLRNIIYRGKKKGYIFSEDIIPQRPKRITQKFLQQLQLTTAADVYASSYYVNPETGEAVSGLEQRKEVKRRAGRIAAATRKARKSYGSKSEQEYEYFPKVPIYDAILDLLDTIPDALFIHGSESNISDRKNMAKDIFIEAWERESHAPHGSDPRYPQLGYQNFIDYWNDKYSIIQEYVQLITFASDQDVVEYSFGYLFRILNYQKDLTLEQAKGSATLADFANGLYSKKGQPL